jgi:hypothetical protein
MGTGERPLQAVCARSDESVLSSFRTCCPWPPCPGGCRLLGGGRGSPRSATPAASSSQLQVFRFAGRDQEPRSAGARDEPAEQKHSSGRVRILHAEAFSAG